MSNATVTCSFSTPSIVVVVDGDALEAADVVEDVNVTLDVTGEFDGSCAVEVTWLESLCRDDVTGGFVVDGVPVCDDAGVTSVLTLLEELVLVLEVVERAGGGDGNVAVVSGDEGASE